jgi:hypothetical protein
MLRAGNIIVAVVLGGLAGSAALAFQETKGGTGQSTGPATEVTVPAYDLKGTGTSISTSPPAGLEVRIPGLGKLGVLPKFDFGLELLYGANDGKSPEQPDRGISKDSEDVQIRGAIRHRW